MKQVLTGTYQNRTINLLNISEVIIYHYTGPVAAVIIKKIKYTAEKIDNYDEPDTIEFNTTIGDISRNDVATREEATVICTQLRDQIVADWERALSTVHIKG